MNERTISLVAAVLVIGFIVVLATRESGHRRMERNWKHKYDSLDKALAAESELRKKERELRLASEARIIVIKDSVRVIRKVDSLLIVKQKALPAKYKKIIENATDKELLQKLDSAFMR